MSEGQEGGIPKSIGQKIKQVAAEKRQDAQQFGRDLKAGDPMTRRTFLRGMGVAALGLIGGGLTTVAVKSGSEQKAQRDAAIAKARENAISQTPQTAETKATSTTQQAMAARATAAAVQSPPEGNTSQPAPEVTPVDTLPPSPIVKEGTVPPENKHERNVFGKFKAEKEPKNIDTTIIVTDADYNPILKDGKPVTIPIPLEGVRRYLNEDEGGDGKKQYMYKYHPELNVTEISGPKHEEDPFKRLMVINAHSGPNMPSDALRIMHDEKVVDGQLIRRTPEEAAEFRKGFNAIFELRWKDKDGIDQRQLARARMHHINAANKERFRVDDEAKNKPNPLVVDYFDEKDGIPDRLDPWNKFAVFAICGLNLKGESENPNLPPSMQDNICLFLEAMDDNRGPGRQIADTIDQLKNPQQ